MSELSQKEQEAMIWQNRQQWSLLGYNQQIHRSARTLPIHQDNVPIFVPNVGGGFRFVKPKDYVRPVVDNGE